MPIFRIHRNPASSEPGTCISICGNSQYPSLTSRTPRMSEYLRLAWKLLRERLFGLGELYEERDRVTVNIDRRELREWLRESEEGQTVEEAVSELLSRGKSLHW